MMLVAASRGNYYSLSLSLISLFSSDVLRELTVLNVPQRC